MPARSFLLTDQLEAYVEAHTDPEDPVLRRLRERTAVLGPVAGMQIGVDQARFLTTLTRFGRVEQAVEVGTFTGTSALCIARGLAPGGQLLCCDISEEWTAIARDAWRDAGVDDRIELRIGPALSTLETLPSEPHLDLVFVDADKGGYVDYFEALVPRLRPGGLLVADNTLWSGRVADPETTDDDTAAIRRFNDHAAADDRVDTVLLALADGVTLCQRR